MAKDLHAPTLKIYREILMQLEELKELYADAADADTLGDDEEELETQQNVMDAIIEDAAEHGMDEEDVAPVFKAVGIIAKKAQES